MIVTRYHRIFYKLFWNLYKLLTGIQPGVYIQDVDHIHIGKNVWIAPGVKIIARNHNIYDLSRHDEWEDVIIEDWCWVGANAVILPGVHLGKHTVVGGGSVVTKSFPEGYCVIAGNPAKKIRNLSTSQRETSLPLGRG